MLGLICRLAFNGRKSVHAHVEIEIETSKHEQKERKEEQESVALSYIHNLIDDVLSLPKRETVIPQNRRNAIPSNARHPSRTPAESINDNLEHHLKLPPFPNIVR